MVKSLTKSHENLLQEREKIESQIKDLESKLGSGIIALIKQNNGFKVPYPLLCGAIQETLDNLNIQKDKHQNWTQKGDKFLRSIQPKKVKHNDNRAT